MIGLELNAPYLHETPFEMSQMTDLAPILPTIRTVGLPSMYLRLYCLIPRAKTLPSNRGRSRGNWVISLKSATVPVVWTASGEE